MQDSLKQQTAQAAMRYVDDDMIIGVGTGSTVNYFIEALSAVKHRIEACVASSKATAAKLAALRIPLIDLNAVQELPLYVDGADEIQAQGMMIKGGGGAATREKIIASVARKFVCIVDESKLVNRLGAFPVAIEVLPIARSAVARALVQLGGSPAYREGFLTDNGNIILDVHGLEIQTPIALEEALSLIPGVVGCGLFAKRRADVILVASPAGVKEICCR